MNKRFPRKAKKWAKRNGVELISARGGTYRYSRSILNGQHRLSVLVTDQPIPSGMRPFW